MTPDELLELLKQYPLMVATLATAPSKFQALHDSGLPADIQIIAIVCVPIEALTTRSRAVLHVLKP